MNKGSDAPLADQIEALGYTKLFNAIADAVRLEWGGTAIGVSPSKFIASIRASTRAEDTE